MRFIEKTAVLLALIGLTFKLLFIAGGAVILLFAILLLSVVYLILGFALFNGIKITGIFSKSSYAGIPSLHIAGAILTGFAMAHACLGMLFAFFLWRGYAPILAVSSGFCLVAILVSLLFRHRGGTMYYRRILSRTVIAAAICLVLLLTPRIVYFRVMYRNHPAYIEALEQLRKDPANKALRDKVEEEWKKTTVNDSHR